jgi:hypothetical protein
VLADCDRRFGVEVNEPWIATLPAARASSAQL